MHLFERRLPRYTSYPTAASFQEISSDSFREALKRIRTPLSLYFHIPFCKKLCRFCGCTTLGAQSESTKERYTKALKKEMALLSSIIGSKCEVTQIHFGGGTPSELSREHFYDLIHTLHTLFLLSKNGEYSIEFDPRAPLDLIPFFKDLLFNRISFGIQDTNEKVQAAIGRHQSLAMTRAAIASARECGFEEINCDLIYGLPFQTKSSFSETLEEIIALLPERLALFSWARLPHLKPLHKTIAEESLPSLEEKFAIYLMAKELLESSGYQMIGIDHFAKKGSSLEKAYQEKRIQRNFQGYSIHSSAALIGLGLSSISNLAHGYFQNEKNLEDYLELIEKGSFPTRLGKIVSEEDRRRRWVIASLMCYGEVDKKQFSSLFSLCFDSHFEKEKEALSSLEREGFITQNDEKIDATEKGRFHLRHIASSFDSYLTKEQKVIFSSSI